MSETNKPLNEQNEGQAGLSRRDIIKGLVTVPIVGALAYGTWKKKRYDHILRENLRNVTDLSSFSPAVEHYTNTDPKIRIGIIGYGIRGTQLLKAAGFAHPDIIEDWKKAL
ncbi:MAG: gfo/Idh/MocA family oxidoreductase, partial [Bacteroidales bacterium]|nr:gfo/Idh/MocA family oxidoreductase [Bacteroidales bacterium]